MQMTTLNSSNIKTKSDLRVCIRWQPLTGKNDFNRSKKNNKCSNMNWLLFISPKKLTTNVYKTKRSSTEWLISSINWETKKCLHVCARASENGGKMRWRARPAANHSYDWTSPFSIGMETTQRISTNQTKSSDFCVNEEQ